jgi:hypothetical protein
MIGYCTDFWHMEITPEMKFASTIIFNKYRDSLERTKNDQVTEHDAYIVHIFIRNIITLQTTLGVKHVQYMYC